MAVCHQKLLKEIEGWQFGTTKFTDRAAIILALVALFWLLPNVGEAVGKTASRSANISTEASVNPETLHTLAPTGKLRVGLYLGGPTNIIQGTNPRENKGVGYDVAIDLSRGLGVPFEPVVYPNAAGVLGGLKSGQVDIAFLARTPEREKTLLLTATFLSIEHGFLVPSGSTIQNIDAIDRTGIVIGTPQGGSVNVAIAGFVKNATVVPTPGLARAAAMLKAGQLDVFAANKANLFELADMLPGARVLDGHFGVDEITIALPRGREAAMTYLKQYLENAKSQGVISGAVSRAGMRGAIDE